jgi:hypothetical protein
LDWLGFGNHTGGGVLRWPPSTAADWQCAVANYDARFPPSLEMPGLPTPTVVVTNMPHGRYLQLPYKGYLREIICTLVSTAPAARFGFFHAAGDLQDDGPDNLARVRQPLPARHPTFAFDAQDAIHAHPVIMSHEMTRHFLRQNPYCTHCAVVRSCVRLCVCVCAGTGGTRVSRLERPDLQENVPYACLRPTAPSKWARKVATGASDSILTVTVG